MNKTFIDYLSTLTPKRRDLAQEAIAQYLKGEAGDVKKVSNSFAIYNLCRDMSLLDVEHFDILLINQNFKLIKRVNISSGGLTEVATDVRIIFRECLLNNATVLACVHNHPSGGITPSKPDDELTVSIKRACNLMRIHLLDHIIVGDGYYSYRDNGRI